MFLGPVQDSAVLQSSEATVPLAQASPTCTLGVTDQGRTCPQGHRCQKAAAGSARGKAMFSLCTPDTFYRLLLLHQHHENLLFSLTCQQPVLPLKWRESCRDPHHTSCGTSSAVAGSCWFSHVSAEQTHSLPAKETRHGVEGAYGEPPRAVGCS